MKALAFMLIAIGLFACYVTYGLIENQRFADGESGVRSRTTPTVYSAKERPTEFQHSVYIAGGTAIFCLLTGATILVRARKR